MIRSFLLIFTLLVGSADAIRCQCSRSTLSAECHKDWCQVGNVTGMIGACGVVKKGRVKEYVCIRVDKDKPGANACKWDEKNGVQQVSCWCHNEDYCTNDLADRIDDGDAQMEVEKDKTAQLTVIQAERIPSTSTTRIPAIPKTEEDFQFHINQEYDDDDGDNDMGDMEDDFDEEDMKGEKSGEKERALSNWEQQANSPRSTTTTTTVPPWRRVTPLRRPDHPPPPPYLSQIDVPNVHPHVPIRTPSSSPQRYLPTRNDEDEVLRLPDPYRRGEYQKRPEEPVVPRRNATIQTVTKSTLPITTATTPRAIPTRPLISIERVNSYLEKEVVVPPVRQTVRPSTINVVPSTSTRRTTTTERTTTSTRSTTTSTTRSPTTTPRPAPTTTTAQRPTTSSTSTTTLVQPSTEAAPEQRRNHPMTSFNTAEGVGLALQPPAPKREEQHFIIAGNKAPPGIHRPSITEPPMDVVDEEVKASGRVTTRMMAVMNLMVTILVTWVLL